MELQCNIYGDAGVSLALLYVEELYPGFLDLRLTELNIICCPMDAVTFDLSGSGGHLINSRFIKQHV